MGENKRRVNMSLRGYQTINRCLERDLSLQERRRFENPHRAFTYVMHGYEAVVGPVKGVYQKDPPSTIKAREHMLLVNDRPSFVTILTLGTSRFLCR
jgi:hypothetical protein